MLLPMVASRQPRHPFVFAHQPQTICNCHPPQIVAFLGVYAKISPAGGAGKALSMARDAVEAAQKAAAHAQAAESEAAAVAAEAHALARHAAPSPPRAIFTQEA